MQKSKPRSFAQFFFITLFLTFFLINQKWLFCPKTLKLDYTSSFSYNKADCKPHMRKQQNLFYISEMHTYEPHTRQVKSKMLIKNCERAKNS